MKFLSWQIKFSLSLIALSIFFFFIHYLISKDPISILISIIDDFAFVCINVLLVTLVIQKLLRDREKHAKMEKLNMVIGAFFSEVGTKLLSYFSSSDFNLDLIRYDLVVTKDWSDKEFSSVSKRIKSHKYAVDISKIPLKDLRDFLLEKRDFLLRLLENPTLLEHEYFTELLRAVFHLTEELTIRKEFRDLPKTDYEHLTGDIERAYSLLAHEWLYYMKYLKNNYPYLFSLAMRTNPFDKNASPIVR